MSTNMHKTPCCGDIVHKALPSLVSTHSIFASLHESSSSCSISIQLLAMLRYNIQYGNRRNVGLTLGLTTLPDNDN